MRFVLTSDLHGCLPNIPPCDVLLIAGDLCPIDDHSSEYQAEWLHNEFADWLREVPARQTFFVAGNHDLVFERSPERLDPSRWKGVYLQDSGAEWEGIRFWGSPWACELPGWAFTAPEDDLLRRWQWIDPRTQVLIVHGPPRGYGDRVIGRRSGDTLEVGSPTLLEAIGRLDDLRLVVFGHIHESAGEYEYRGVRLVNASLMDLGYEPVNPLRVFDWPD
jgi:Icc-related predicted phosphoesterase